MDILAMVPDIDYRKRVPLFEIRDGNKIKKIVPFLPPYKRRPNVDFLTIVKDSIFTLDMGYPVEDLGTAMKNSIQKYGSSDFHEDNRPYFARVVIDMDSNSTAKDLKKVLLKTTNTFERVKLTESDSLFMIIYFDFLESVTRNSPKKTHDNNG